VAVVQGSRSHPSGEPELLHDPGSDRSIAACQHVQALAAALLSAMEQAKY
jgi:hypothetical protein